MLRHILFWFVLMVVGVLNGILRGTTYGKYFSDLTAHQISTFTGILLTGLVTWFLWSKWPLETAREAWTIGTIWLVLTILFEFGFGHYIMGHSWQKLFADYNILQGRVWSLVLLWILVMPYVFYSILNLKS